MFAFLILALIGVSATEYGKEIRQCTCDEQTQCFAEMKEVTTKCFETSHENANEQLKELSYGLETEKVNPCFAKFQDFVMKFDDCLNEELAKEYKSCVDYKSDQKIAAVDFRALVTKQLRKQVEKRMNHLFGIEKSPKWLQKWHDGAKECAFDKVLKVECFAKNDCGLQATEKQLDKAIRKCYKELKVVEVHYNMCDCMHNKGVGGHLDEYCKNVKETKVPEYER